MAINLFFSQRPKVDEPIRLSNAKLEKANHMNIYDMGIDKNFAN